MTNSHTATLSELEAYVDDLEARLTAARAGYLANLDNANLKTIPDISTFTATEIAYLDNANLKTIADISTLTATEIAYLDAKISEVVKQTALTGHGADSIGKILYELYITRLTSTRAGYLDNLTNLDKAISALGDLSLEDLTSSVLNIRSYIYAASDVLRASDDTPETTVEVAYTKIKEIIIPRTVGGSELRIVFDMKREAAGGTGSYAKIYRNGVAIGTECNENNGTWTEFSEDISGWVGNDRIQLYGYKTGSECDVRNFRIYGDQTVKYYSATLVW